LTLNGTLRRFIIGGNSSSNVISLLSFFSIYFQSASVTTSDSIFGISYLGVGIFGVKISGVRIFIGLFIKSFFFSNSFNLLFNKGISFFLYFLIGVRVKNFLIFLIVD